MKTSLILLTIKQNSNFVINKKVGDLFLESIQIIGNELAEPVSKHLHWRASNPYIGAISALTFSLLLLTIARLSSPHFFYSLFRSIYKNRLVEKIAYEELPVSKLASFSLSVNYLISFSTLVYLFIQEQTGEINLLTYVIALAVPFLFMFAPYFFLTLVELVSGEKGISKEIKLTNWVVCKFLGIVFAIGLLLWVFNAHSHLFISHFIGYLLVGTYIFRLIRGFIFAFSKGLPWYYIILYFCTFEILPVYLAWLFIQGNI